MCLSYAFTISFTCFALVRPFMLLSKIISDYQLFKPLTRPLLASFFHDSCTRRVVSVVRLTSLPASAVSFAGATNAATATTRLRRNRQWVGFFTVGRTLGRIPIYRYSAVIYWRTHVLILVSRRSLKSRRYMTDKRQPSSSIIIGSSLQRAAVSQARCARGKHFDVGSQAIASLSKGLYVVKKHERSGGSH